MIRPDYIASMRRGILAAAFFCLGAPASADTVYQSCEQRRQSGEPLEQYEIDYCNVGGGAKKPGEKASARECLRERMRLQQSGMTESQAHARLPKPCRDVLSPPKPGKPPSQEQCNQWASELMQAKKSLNETVKVLEQRGCKDATPSSGRKPASAPPAAQPSAPASRPSAGSAAFNLSGNWRVAIGATGGSNAGSAQLSQSGSRVSGTQTVANKTGMGGGDIRYGVNLTFDSANSLSGTIRDSAVTCSVASANAFSCAGGGFIRFKISYTRN